MTKLDLDDYECTNLIALLHVARVANLDTGDWLGQLLFKLGTRQAPPNVSVVEQIDRLTNSGRMSAVFAAACAWRDSSRAPDALAGEVPDTHEARLIAAVDAARAAKKEGSS